MNRYFALVDDIELNYNCKEDGDEDDNEEGTFTGGAAPVTPEIAPSGYVYEAVLSNRLEGVTATCYQKVVGEDMYGDPTEEAVVWNAADYSQVNPQQTDATGFYRWDVPQGMWQVKYEKEGYETAYSDWLPVPPPQLDVNIAMKQSTPPTVKQMRGYESGITIDMSKYMLPTTMTTQNITVTHNGTAVNGTVQMLNAEQAPLSGETYVQKVKFVPQKRFFGGDEVVVTIAKNVKSYCGVTMARNYVQTVKIVSEITAIMADSVVTVPYQGERELTVLVLPKEASAGRTLIVKSSSPMIASVSEEKVIIDENGTAVLTVGGELPGGAVLDFCVDSTEVTCTTRVKVVIGHELVATPTASIASGSEVKAGTAVMLSCDTEDATIWYTTDDSCPATVPMPASSMTVRPLSSTIA